MKNTIAQSVQLKSVFKILSFKRSSWVLKFCEHFTFHTDFVHIFGIFFNIYYFLSNYVTILSIYEFKEPWSDIEANFCLFVVL